MTLLPNTIDGSEFLAKSGLLSETDMQIRLAAILKAAELPESEALYTAMEKVGKEATNSSDKWLNAAIKVYFRELNHEEVDVSAVEMIVPSAEEKATTWHYTTVKPADNWMTVDFKDVTWKKGNGMFGAPSDDQIQTKWTKGDIWLRKEVILKEEIEDPVIKIAYDDDYEIYINGQLLLSETGASITYKYIKVDKEKSHLFKTGKNVIAVHCKNTGGNQHIDLGIGKIGKIKADVRFNINTVSQEMAFDKTELHATVGQTIEIILNNKDQMPHNLVVIQAGSLGDFGSLVDSFVVKPEAEAMGYVPNSRYVLGAIEMLTPNETSSIIIKLPNKPGRYPFVCTFPGHWRFMQGVIIVTESKDDV